MIGLVAANPGCKSKEELARALQHELALIKTEWKSGVKTYHSDLKSYVTEQVTVLKELLSKAPEGAVEFEFTRMRSTNVSLELATDDLDERYDIVMLETLVVRSIDAKDRSRLLALLTYNCPREGEHMMPLEMYSAVKWPESILVIFEAHDQTASESVKKEILLHLSHTFDSLRNKFADDSVFMKEARKWFIENRDRVTINPRYPYVAGQPPPFRDTPKDLFILTRL